jgi:thiol-disulfide isomerase/thioredoxin
VAIPMVDWDRVEELRSKGWDWERIAADEDVGFHTDASVGNPGRALRALYHRQRSRDGRKGRAASAPSKKEKAAPTRNWSLPRVGYLLTPIFGVWTLFAYVAPSPVGLLLPAFPWLALLLAVAAFILLFGLLRNRRNRWSKELRTTLVVGVVLGLLVAGLVGVTGYIAFGCPYLPPSSSLSAVSGSGTGSGSSAVAPWTTGSLPKWQEGGKPVLYFYGASWCPYCSAGSWSLYKALSEYGNVSGANAALSYSSSTDVYASTPEIILADLGYSSSWISFQVSEDLSGVEGNFPGTSNCYESAYVSAYSASSIPFAVVNGQFVHGGSQLIYPQTLSDWAGTGAQTVLSSVQSESGAPWSAIQFQAWWIMALLAKSTGASVSTLSADLHWSASTTNAVNADYAQI